MTPLSPSGSWSVDGVGGVLASAASSLGRTSRRRGPPTRRRLPEVLPCAGARASSGRAPGPATRRAPQSRFRAASSPRTPTPSPERSSVNPRLVGFLPPAGRLGRRSDRLTQQAPSSRDHSPKQNGFRAASAFCATDGVGVRQSAANNRRTNASTAATRVAALRLGRGVVRQHLADQALRRRRARFSRAAHKSSNDARGRSSFADHCSARARCETQDARRDAAARSCGAAV